MMAARGLRLAGGSPAVERWCSAAVGVQTWGGSREEDAVGGEVVSVLWRDSNWALPVERSTQATGLVEDALLAVMDVKGEGGGVDRGSRRGRRVKVGSLATAERWRRSSVGSAVGPVEGG